MVNQGRSQDRRRRMALLLPVLVRDGAGQTPATGRLMREKLTHAQRLLEALTTSDHALLERESDALAEDSVDAGLDGPAVARSTAATATRFSGRPVISIPPPRRRDLDEAMMHYQTMTASCYQCHRFL